LATAQDISKVRTPPHNLQAERAVLGTFYLNPNAVADVYAILQPEDFYDPRHQEIFRVVVDLFERNAPIDPMVLINEIGRLGRLEKIGGPAYLTGLQQYVVSPGNVLHHARIVREKSMLRQLLRVSAEIAENAYSEPEEAEELVRDSERRVFEILKESVGRQFSPFEKVVQEVYDDVARRSEYRQEVTGLPTHFRRLDSLTGGFQRSDLIILAARPSVGKTSLALNIAAQAAMGAHAAPDGGRQRPGVALFSLEMSESQVVQRMICTRALVSMDKLRKNVLSHQEVEKFKVAAQEMRDAPIFVNDTPGIDPVELRLQAQHLKMRCPNLALIVVDYLQLMSVRRRRMESRQQEVSEISRSLKSLARDLEVPVLALSQLSRGIESRRGADREPKLSDLRESGAIEQDGDVVMFIHRRATGVPESQAREEPNVVADLIIAKQRNGPLGRVGMVFRADFTQFAELASREG